MPPEVLVLADVGVIDGDGTRREHQHVVVADGRIRALGPIPDVHPDEHAGTLAGPRLTVLPGLIDAHVHLGLTAPEDVVRGGVTFVRDLGWPVEALRALREDSLSLPSPGLAFAGRILTVPGGYPTRAAWAPPGTAREVRDRADATRAVEEAADLGAVVIKIALDPRVGPTLPLELVREIVDAADAVGLGVGAHVAAASEVEKALDAGVSELVHWPLGPALPPTLVARLARRATVVPTLHIEPSPARLEPFKEFVEAGGKVVYGTDLGNAGPPPGVDLTELRLLAGAGLTPAGIIRCATGEAARQVRLTDRGRIAAGLAADLVIVEGDPLRDVAALANIRAVFRDGLRVR